MNKFINKNQGFTIIETLVAVAILMISIAGPLTIAQKALSASLYAKDQVIASYLAQQEMEYIKNLKDNYITYRPGMTFANFKNYKICPMEMKVLNIQTNGTYGIDSGTPSRFKIGSCISALPADNPNIDNEATAKVKVTWSNGTIENEVVLENQLFNISK
jgi:prepilin-type N-terminal cleavage/methylation domain-containing protein